MNNNAPHSQSEPIPEREARIADLERRLAPALNTRELASFICEELRTDQAREMPTSSLADALTKENANRFTMGFPEETVDINKLFDFLQKLVCPPPCVGYVNSTGWHQLCQRKAADAIAALGFTPPPIDPVPKGEDWDF